MDDGSTKEEWKMVVETKKILDAGIEVFATCVRIPTFIGHGEAVRVEFKKPITDEQARAALRKGAALNAVQIAEELIKTSSRSRCRAATAATISRRRSIASPGGSDRPAFFVRAGSLEDAVQSAPQRSFPLWRGLPR